MKTAKWYRAVASGSSLLDELEKVVLSYGGSRFEFRPYGSHPKADEEIIATIKDIGDSTKTIGTWNNLVAKIRNGIGVDYNLKTDYHEWAPLGLSVDFIDRETGQPRINVSGFAIPWRPGILGSIRVTYTEE